MGLTKYKRADAAIAAYEAIVCAAVGHNDEATETRIAAAHLDALDACEAATRGRAFNKVTRDYYANEARWFRQML